MIVYNRCYYESLYNAALNPPLDHSAALLINTMSSENADWKRLWKVTYPLTCVTAAIGSAAVIGTAGAQVFGYQLIPSGVDPLYAFMTTPPFLAHEAFKVGAIASTLKMLAPHARKIPTLAFHAARRVGALAQAIFNHPYLQIVTSSIH